MILGKNIIVIHVDDARKILKRLEVDNRKDAEQLQREGLLEIIVELREIVREFDSDNELLYHD